MKNEFRISKLETALIVGIIGCLLLATWELMNLTASEWLADWVKKDKFTNRRIIFYGVAFFFSSLSVLVALKSITRESRFIYTINRSLLWYGSILLISTIAVFVFDCLPEVAAGVIGALFFAYTIYLLQKKFFSDDRIRESKILKNQCIECGFDKLNSSNFCPNCGCDLKCSCSKCEAMISVTSKYCTECGESTV